LVIAYLRVSGRSQSVETQRDAIKRLAKARNEPIERWFEEKRTAKALTDRPTLEALRDLIRGGGVRVLYVYRIDRLSRSGIRDTFTLLEEFRGRGVVIVTVADGFTMEGPGADIVLAVLAWAAQMERLAIGERISDAHKRVKSQGLAWGRPRRVDQKTKELIWAAHDLGRSIRKLAIAYKIPRSTVSRVVSQKPTPPEQSDLSGKKGGDRGVDQ
jgi:DNA invertase Pin-like site-specific DNA recombinase